MGEHRRRRQRADALPSDNASDVQTPACEDHLAMPKEERYKTSASGSVQGLDHGIEHVPISALEATFESSRKTDRRQSKKHKKKKKNTGVIAVILAFIVIVLLILCCLYLCSDLFSGKTARDQDSQTGILSGQESQVNQSLRESDAADTPSPSHESEAPAQDAKSVDLSVQSLLKSSGLFSESCQFTFSDGTQCGNAVENGTTLCQAHKDYLEQL